jgi:hypothetical protein
VRLFDERLRERAGVGRPGAAAGGLHHARHAAVVVQPQTRGPGAVERAVAVGRLHGEIGRADGRLDLLRAAQAAPVEALDGDALAHAGGTHLPQQGIGQPLHGNDVVRRAQLGLDVETHVPGTEFAHAREHLRQGRDACPVDELLFGKPAA